MKTIDQRPICLLSSPTESSITSEILDNMTSHHSIRYSTWNIALILASDYVIFKANRSDQQFWK